MTVLPIFHDKPSKDPYRREEKVSQVCEINQIYNAPVDVMKIKLFPATLRVIAKILVYKIN